MKRKLLDRPFRRNPSRSREDLTQPYSVYTDKPDARIEMLEPGLVGFANTNVVLHSRVPQKQYTEHVGPLTLVFVGKGHESCDIDSRRFVIDENYYLIHNLGQRVNYVSDKDADVESFVIGFWPGFAEDVLRSLTTPADKLLDAPTVTHTQPVQFFNQLYPHDDILSPALFQLREALENNTVTHGWLEEHNHLLLERMLYVHRHVLREVDAIPALRASTRAEIYQRLHQARDFMEANLDRPISIPDIASAAWFSPHHFLRQFKQVFRETPHQYLIRRRMDRARRLLTQTDLTVTDVCFAVGFESLGSFSWLFRQRVGQSPEHFRNYHRTRTSVE